MSTKRDKISTNSCTVSMQCKKQNVINKQRRSVCGFWVSSCKNLFLFSSSTKADMLDLIPTICLCVNQHRRNKQHHVWLRRWQIKIWVDLVAVIAVMNKSWSRKDNCTTLVIFFLANVCYCCAFLIVEPSIFHYIYHPIFDIYETRSQCWTTNLPEAPPAQLLPLPCLRVVLHADVVGVEFMTRDVGEKLREVQPPQKLHGVGVAPIDSTAGAEPVVEREGKGQRQGKNRSGVEVGTSSSAAGGSHRATTPAETSPDQKVFPLRVHVGWFEELPQLPGASQTCSSWCQSSSGREGEARRRRLPRGVTWGFLRRPQSKRPSCSRCSSLCRVLSLYWLSPR